MIDYLTLLLTHSLIALALWRLLFRPELDVDDAHARPVRRPWHQDDETEGTAGDA